MFFNKKKRIKELEETVERLLMMVANHKDRIEMLEEQVRRKEEDKGYGDYLLLKNEINELISDIYKDLLSIKKIKD